MEFSLVDGKRSHPKPKLQGTCPVCGHKTISKCGTKILWHWAHKGKRHCDPWWENETDWHRAWKGYFPESQREIVHFDENSGEKHIADVKTKRGLVIEFQHSAMPSEELISREEFYDRMIWIVDGKAFEKQFKVFPDPIPHPKAELHQDIVFMAQGSRTFRRKSEAEAGSNMYRIHCPTEITEEIEANYRGHHFFDWKRPRTVWFESKVPVFFDFGGEELLRLVTYPRDQMLKAHPNTFPWWCIQKISKKALIEKNGGTYPNKTN